MRRGFDMLCVRGLAQLMSVDYGYDAIAIDCNRQQTPALEE